MRKTKEVFYFSVEGECEKHYFVWLQQAINSCEYATGKVKFNIEIKKDPLSFAKGLNQPYAVDAYHIIDVESNEEFHIYNFKSTLDKLHKVEKEMSGKVKKYTLGYSNFTFELWLILHKKNLKAAKNHRKEYLKDINSAFAKKYRDLEEFKSETEFQRVLNTLTLDDVKQAINHAEGIIAMNEERGYKHQHHHKYKYYRENPSLSIHEVIKTIFNKVGLL